MVDAEDYRHPSGRTLYSVSRSAKADVLLTTYFLGMALAGVEGLIHPGELGTLLEAVTGGLASDVFSWSMIVVGLAGIMARLADSRQGEFYAILGISLLTVFNGVLLLPEHMQTAVRLVVAPCMMIPYGWMRLGFTVSREDVYQIQQALRDQEASGGDER